MKTIEDAEKLSRLMVDLGKEVGRKTVAVITNMSQPLGRAIGNRLEVLEALEIMQGKGREDITHFICELGQIMLRLAGVDKSLEDIRKNLVDGTALAKFEEMVTYQGGDLKDLYRESASPVQTEVFADEDGYITELPALEFGLFAMRLGAGRAVKTDPLDYESGIVFDKKIGDPVSKGDLIAVIFSQEVLPKKVLTEFEKNVKIGVEQFEPKEIIKIIS